MAAGTIDDGYVALLVAEGRAAGLTAVGVAPATPMRRAQRILERRKADGLHAGMQFTYRNPARSTDPSRALAGARALVVGAYAYRRDEPAPPSAVTGGSALGRVARFAWTDHYRPLRIALGAIADMLRGDGWEAVVVADDNALVDREAAHRAGLGWFGKNANLLLPGRGSWFLLGSVITTAPLPPARRLARDGCGACRACLEGCPTGAIVAPGVVDARRCLAWLVQQQGPFPRRYRKALGDRLYGCDDCQEVCPPNQRLGARTTSPLGNGDGGGEGDGVVAAWVPVVDLLDADDDDLLARHGAWYVPGREPRWLRRNALVVLGNVGDGGTGAVARVLRDYLGHADPMLRAHAVWAARRLGRDDLLAAVAADDAPEVRDELRAPL